MKKLTKIALIVAIIMGIVGIGCLIGAVSMGLTWGTFTDMVDDGKLSFGTGATWNFGEDGKADGSITEVDEVFRSLDVELKSGKLEIYYDDVDKVQVEQEETPDFKCYVEDSTLHVEGGQKFGVNSDQASIVIRIPHNFSFAEFELEVGAGEATVDGVIANEASIDVGAGKASITKLNAKEVDASAGVGELYLEVVGKKEDYSYNLECGIGELKVGDETYSGLGGERTIQNKDAEHFLDAECGIGKMQIDFTE